MNQLKSINFGTLTDFKPEVSKERVSVLEAAIQHAKNMQMWEQGWEAVDLLIREQSEFVKWWEANVARPGGDKKSGNHCSRPSTMISVDRAEKDTEITKERVSKWRKALNEPKKYREKLFGAAHNKAMADDHNHRAQGTGENEWYTPEQYIEAARRVLGNIDLDPASSYTAQTVVKADNFFTVRDNGLAKDWHGRVWLNPPYAQPAISNFVSKMVSERAAERVEAAIMLTHNYTDTAWFHEAVGIADAICFTRGRIKFLDPEGNDCAPTQGQAFFYYGESVDKFAAEFVNVGFVVQCL